MAGPVPEGRLEVYLDTSGLSKEIDRLSGSGRQIIVAIVLVGMIIALPSPRTLSRGGGDIRS